MWFLVAREPRPDAAYWPGRRWLAVADALGWPLVWACVLEQPEVSLGVVGPTALALLFLVTFRRMHRALWLNHRYVFTTWRWGKLVGGLLVLGWVMKMSLAG